MRKPKSTSVIDGLPRNQKETLERWLFEENVSLKDAADRLYQDFSVRSSESAVRRYWQREQLNYRIAKSARGANAAMDAFAKNPANTYEAVLGSLGVVAFEELQKGKEVSIKTVTDLTDRLLAHQAGKLKAQAEERKERELQLKKEKLELEVRKYQQQFEKAKGALESNLTAEEKQQRLRQIFGMT